MGVDQADLPHAVHERTDVLNAALLVCGRRVFELLPPICQIPLRLRIHDVGKKYNIQNLQPGLGQRSEICLLYPQTNTPKEPQ
jgi:hypothetical protein